VARLIEGRYGCDIYGEVIETVRRFGRRQDSRNGVVYDLSDITISLESPLNALPVGCGRNLNPRIAAAEALQLIGGFTEPEWLCRIAPQFSRFREDIVIGSSKSPWFHGSYGMRISTSNQLEVAYRRLYSTPETRQAVVTLWDPKMDTEEDHLDYPCTVALNFRLSGTHYRQHDRLNMQVLMRSNDVWLGLPYDLFQFTQLQLTMCNVLSVQPGTYTHTAWSMHLYLTDLEKSYNVTDTLNTPKLMPHVRGFGGRGEHFIEARDRARHTALRVIEDPTESEKWYLDTLKDFPINPSSVDVAPDPDRDGAGAGEAQPV